MRRAGWPVGIVVLGASACGNFEDPAIVLDLRPLAMIATPPEQVIELDITNPPDPTEIELAPFDLVALVAEPGVTQDLAWSMQLCPIEDDLRCDPERPRTPIASGTIADPESGNPRPVIRATFDPGLETFDILRDAIEEDPFAGFSGIDLEIELRVAPVGTPLEEGVFASKLVRFAAKQPPERTANTNPRLDRIDFDVGGTPAPLTLAAAPNGGRCGDLGTALEVRPGGRVHLMPIEPPDVREVYVVPTFDGGFRMFTENIRYQWLATAGSWTRDDTGGPLDPVGNPPLLDTAWEAPPAEDVDGPFDVMIWVVVRDERLGANWYESCFRVVP